jgi:hypothetical protein
MTEKLPSAIISVSGSEQKIYKNNQLFIENGKNFEINFFNPLQEKISVKIIFNGEYKTSSSLILRPGENIMIDRFLNNNKKMKFETYHIDKNNNDAKKAIINNGLIEFNFFKEKNINYHNYYYFDNGYNNFGDNIKYADYICADFGDNIKYADYISTNIEKNEIGNFGDNIFNDTLDISDTSYANIISTNIEKIETGRIEQGSISNQQFENVINEFETTPFHIIKYKLNPNNNNNENIRNYCSKCGYRLRKSNWNYCPKCGENII